MMPLIAAFAIAVVGIAAILLLMPGPIQRLRKLETPSRGTEDALDLDRLDDDGGWQMSRPPA